MRFLITDTLVALEKIFYLQYKLQMLSRKAFEAPHELIKDERNAQRDTKQTLEQATILPE